MALNYYIINLIYGSNKIDENTMYYGAYGNNNTYQLSIIKIGMMDVFIKRFAIFKCK